MTKKKKKVIVDSYRLGLINMPGVTCASIIGSGLHYSTNGKQEPTMSIVKEFKVRRRKRYETVE